MPDSIFTKIIQRELPAKIVYEDEQFIAFHDINPHAPIDVLLVTKEPFASLEAVPKENSEIHAQLLLTARKVAKLLGTEKNYKLIMNVGKRIQQVHHLHLHIMGGWDTKTDPKQLALSV